MQVQVREKARELGQEQELKEKQGQEQEQEPEQKPEPAWVLNDPKESGSEHKERWGRNTKVHVTRGDSIENHVPATFTSR